MPSSGVRISTNAAVSSSRNPASPRAAKISDGVDPVRRVTAASVSTNSQPSRSARSSPTVVLPDPIMPTNTSRSRIGRRRSLAQGGEVAIEVPAQLSHRITAELA